MENYVLLKDLARELGLDKSNTRKYVLKAGFSFLKVRTPEGRGQLTLALAVEDAETIRELRQSQGYVIGKHPGKIITDNGDGFFYIIQLVPELEANRVKLGFATDVDSRLQSHRTAAPTAQLVKAWPCKRSWEPTAITSLTREDCELLSGEVFRVGNLDLLIERGNAFFAIMPT
jgi:hypothetical protein